MWIKRRLKTIGLAALLGAATTVYADPAPVYDADDFEAGEFVEHQAPSAPPAESRANASSSSSSASSSYNSGNGASVSQRLNKIEQQLNNVVENTSAAHVESLQAQVQTLRDQVETLTHTVEQLQTEQKTSYTDLDDRLSKLTNAADNQAIEKSILPKPATKEVATKKADDKKLDSQPDVAEEQQIYQTAYTLIKDKKYDEAVNVLQSMLKKYPRGQFASNAHYWLGELYGLLGQHDKSLSEFVTVVTNYPKSPRVPDAQLKVGLIFASESKWSEAKSSFNKVINRYPGTASARLASEQLKQLKKAGH